MDESKLIFFTGAPGSKWSAVSYILSECMDVDTTDRTPERLMVHKDVYNGVRHTGLYFGPGNELGHDFHQLQRLSKNQVKSEIQAGWATWDDSKYHIVRCHQFINNIDWLVKYFPDSKIVVVARRPESSIAGWMSVGGIDIPYPHYKEYYKDNETAKELITQETQLAHEAFFDYEMDIHVGSKGHFKQKFGLEFEEDSVIAKYVRSVEGFMYKQEVPRSKLKHDVLIGYHGF